MKKLFALLCIFSTLAFFTPTVVSAAPVIAFDNSTTCFNNGGSITSGCTLTVAATGNPIVLVACEENAQSVTSVTVNSVTATLIDSQNVSGGTFTKVYDYYVVGQSGSNLAVVVNVNNSLNNYCSVASYTGVDQSNPIDNHTTNTGTSITSLTTSLTVAANSWLVAFGGYTNVNSSGNSGLAGAGTTQRHLGPNGPNDATPWYGWFDSNGALSAGSQSLIIKRTDSGQISVNMVSLKVASAAAAFSFWQFFGF